jgi:glucosyl-dolichyl phosphate glucuronosyltransferase
VKDLLKKDSKINFISILICTKNRCNLLLRTLESICLLEIPKSIQYEIVLVDNGSTDDTNTVVKTYLNKIPIHYIFEQRGGHSFCLNTGIRNSNGQLILMTDDDVFVDKHWLLKYWETANRHPNAGYYFGIINPVFESLPPSWWKYLAPRSLSGRFIGNEIKCFSSASWDADMIGVNIAAPKSILLKYNFDNFLGGSKHTGFCGGADTKLGREIMNAGYSSYYIPDAIVNHYIPTERIKFNYLKKRKKSIGRASVYFEEVNLKILFIGLLTSISLSVTYLFFNNNKSRKYYLEFLKNIGKALEIFYYKFKYKQVYEGINHL